MQLPCLIGLDLGTSSTKALLVDEAGTVLAWAREEYPMHRPHPGWAENDPDDWVDAVAQATRRVVAASGIVPACIKGLCIVAQRDPLVFLDAAGRVLRRSISWTDLRDRAETDCVYDGLGRDRLFATCGLVPVPGLALPVVHWVRRHDPEAWQQARHILAAKDYILFRLTGRIATDTST